MQTEVEVRKNFKEHWDMSETCALGEIAAQLAGIREELQQTNTFIAGMIIETNKHAILARLSATLDKLTKGIFG